VCFDAARRLCGEQPGLRPFCDDRIDWVLMITAVWRKMLVLSGPKLNLRASSGSALTKLPLPTQTYWYGPGEVGGEGRT